MQNRIVISPYDPQWPLEFRQLGTPLRAALGALALRVDHIGSTAVPGWRPKMSSMCRSRSRRWTHGRWWLLSRPSAITSGTELSCPLGAPRSMKKA